MLKASEVKSNLSPKYTVANLATLEAAFDRAIASASITGHWPAIVPNANDQIPYDAVIEIAHRYETEGSWVIETSNSFGGNPNRAVIYHPDMTRNLIEGPESAQRPVAAPASTTTSTPPLAQLRKLYASVRLLALQGAKVVGSVCEEDQVSVACLDMIREASIVLPEDDGKQPWDRSPAR